MSETAVRHVVFHLSEYGLRFYAPLSPVLDPFFRSQPFTRLPFILVQPVVHFDDAIPPGFKATATQRTPFTSLCLVPSTFSDIPAGCLAAFGSYAGHVLSHGANVIIPFRIVMEALRMEWIGNITGTLLFMEEVVFDEGLYPVLMNL